MRLRDVFVQEQFIASFSGSRPGDIQKSHIRCVSEYLVKFKGMTFLFERFMHLPSTD